MRRSLAFGLYAAVCLVTAGFASGGDLGEPFIVLVASAALVLVLVGFAASAYFFFDASKDIAKLSLERRSPRK